MIRFNLKHLTAASAVIIFTGGSVLPAIATAMSELQKKVLKSGALYANTEDYCAPVSTATTSYNAGTTDTSGALGLRYPSLGNETEVAANLTNYIKTNKPTSPWLGISADIGTWLFNEAKTRDINPLLIAVIGKQENGFGTSDSVHVKQYFNYFGMKGSEPIDIPGSDYRGFSSASQGITYFMDKVKSNTQSGDRGSYAQVASLYDYLSVHQTGKIIYPGESLGPENGGLDGFDSTMQVYISWTTTDHPNNAYDGNLYNPGIYYTNSIEFINSITGLSLPDIASKGPSTGSCLLTAGSAGGSGLLDSTGYSFPLAPQTKAVGGITEGQTTSTHHDKTAAYDLFSTDSADVYAIYDGVVGVNTTFNGVEGCTAIELYADDGFYYAFLHLKNPTVSDGSRVKAGQKIGQVADASFPKNCIGSAPHLHTDRGCVINGEPQPAGRDECRDPDYIPFLSSIYSRLPG